ncbi:hypothetical protein ANN_18414 [Periplaneta americana]|uniref:Uncharacterized protein n=1 Tax=Periplaneta americana TaxID=6978 RepID=A0ABQ8SQT0_PERAM|nr:hypothetical protein ANN_18414 [Periplaneta americana]
MEEAKHCLNNLQIDETEHLTSTSGVINNRKIRTELRQREYNAWCNLPQKGKGIILYSEFTPSNKWITKPDGMTSGEWKEAIKMTANVSAVRAIPAKSVKSDEENKLKRINNNHGDQHYTSNITVRHFTLNTVRREIRTHDQRPAREQIARAPRSTEGRRAEERREGKGAYARGEAARAAATYGVKGERTLPTLPEARRSGKIANSKFLGYVAVVINYGREGVCVRFMISSKSVQKKGYPPYLETVSSIRNLILRTYLRYKKDVCQLKQNCWITFGVGPWTYFAIINSHIIIHTIARVQFTVQRAILVQERGRSAIQLFTELECMWLDMKIYLPRKSVDEIVFINIEEYYNNNYYKFSNVPSNGTVEFRVRQVANRLGAQTRISSQLQFSCKNDAFSLVRSRDGNDISVFTKYRYFRFVIIFINNNKIHTRQLR